MRKALIIAALAIGVAVTGCGADGSTVDAGAGAETGEGVLTLPPEEMRFTQVGSANLLPRVGYESLSDLVWLSDRGVVVATVTDERAGEPTPEVHGETRQLRFLTLDVEQVISGDAVQAGASFEVDDFGWRTKDGETVEDLKGGCVRLRPGYRVVIALLSGEDTFAMTCESVFVLDQGQVVDTGRPSPWIAEAEQGSETDLLTALSRIAGSEPPPTTTTEPLPPPPTDDGHDPSTTTAPESSTTTPEPSTTAPEPPSTTAG
ncbi:MAG TPA: hypothetical protein VGO60_06120 [Iamia sp.]|nr:hypothetical protein [Iamia sp.]